MLFMGLAVAASAAAVVAGADTAGPAGTAAAGAVQGAAVHTPQMHCSKGAARLEPPAVVVAAACMRDDAALRC